MLSNLKALVDNKLACIDSENGHSQGETKTTKLNHELTGIKQTLYEMGINLEIHINPYYYKNGERSTCKLRIYEK